MWSLCDSTKIDVVALCFSEDRCGRFRVAKMSQANVTSFSEMLIFSTGSTQRT